MPLDRFAGPVNRIDLIKNDLVTHMDMIYAETHLDNHKRLIQVNTSIYTSDSFADLIKSLIENDHSASRCITEQEIGLVGIDCLSNQQFDSSSGIHKILLENEVAILECLKSTGVECGFYNLICLPLKLYVVLASLVCVVFYNDPYLNRELTNE